MNQQNLTFAGFAFAALVFVACGDDSKTSGGSVEDQEVIAISDKTISGVSQKGPFVNGSSVTVQELNGETLAQTGDSYEGKIKNDLGEFSVKVTKLASQYALLKANGFYRNEVTGEKSKSQVTLYALTDLSERDEVNVNLLTHLAYERSLYLATGKDSLSVSGAKKQAEAEVLKTFGIEGDFAAAEDLNIFGENDQSAALLAVSVLMQGNLSEGDFSERLANYAADIESDGVWNDSQTATKIADWANSQGLGSGLVKIRENITKWELSADVPAFEKYVNNFWWQNYGLGICDKKRESEVLKNQNSASENADEYYICKSSSWQVASDLEKDTYKWATGKDADVKYGDVVKENCYVFEDKAWRVGNKLDCSLDLQGCTKLRQDTVGKGSDNVWYICDKQNWRNATNIEKDTATWGFGKNDGEIRAGQVNEDCFYIYEKKDNVWREASVLERDVYNQKCTEFGQIVHGKVNQDYIYFCYGHEWKRFYGNDTISYGKMIDDRDGRVYRTVKIGNQVWMAENLDFSDSLNYPSLLNRTRCYSGCNNSLDSCAKYGRLYTWSAAIDSVYWYKKEKICGYGEEPCGLPDKVQGICPNGWHLPNGNEWNILYSSMDDNYLEMQAGGFDVWENASDDYGFSALPAGYYCNCLTYNDRAGFWSSTENTDNISDWSLRNACFWHLEKKSSGLKCISDDFSSKYGYYSVRCVKD